MSDLISREKLMESLGMNVNCEECQYFDSWLCDKSQDWVDCCTAICDAPAVDAVPVVRCRECVYYDGDYNYCCNDIFAKPNGYCSYAKRAERKDDEHP